MNRSHPYSQVLRRVLPAVLVMLGVTGGISGQVSQADQNAVTLFVLDFDNRYGDPRLEWLTQALKDMVLLRMEEERRITGRDAGDVTPFLDSRMGDRAGETTRLASNNLVLMGAYWREDARLVVDLQLLDMRNWSSLGRAVVEALYSDIPQLNQSLAAKVRDLVRGVEFFSGIDIDALIVRKKPRAVLPELDERPAYTPPDEDYQRQILSHQEDLARALDDLEEAMDVYSGYKQEPSGTQQTGEAYYRDFSLEGMGALPAEKARHTAQFEDILQRVARNPYSAEIGDLDLAVDPYKDNRIFISIPVAYTVKQDLLEEMLYSLPYVSTREERNLRMLRYDKSKFNFTNNLVDRIARGDYRMIPVVQLLDPNGALRAVIVDSPDMSWERYFPRRGNVRVVRQKRFYPLLAITTSGFNVDVRLETADVDIFYELDIQAEQLSSYARVVVNFMKEDELYRFLAPLQ
ncbi:hypothetical protein ACFL6Q_03850 [Candidatus Neomarinimicrobiota bacterium]